MNEVVKRRDGDVSQTIDDSDPLMELVRIVSGEDVPEPKAATPVQKPEAQPTLQANVEQELNEAFTALDEASLQEPAETLAHQPEAQDAFPSLEDELEAMLPGMGSSQINAQPAAETVAGIAPVEADVAYTDASIEAAATESAPTNVASGPASLEDELMAELALGSDVAPQTQEAVAAVLPAGDAMDGVVESTTPDVAERASNDEAIAEFDLENALASELTVEAAAVSDPLAELEALAGDMAADLRAESAMPEPAVTAEAALPSAELPADQPFDQEDLGDAFMAEMEGSVVPAVDEGGPDLTEDFSAFLENELSETNLELEPETAVAASTADVELDLSELVPDGPSVQPPPVASLDDEVMAPMPVPEHAVSDPAAIDDPAFATAATAAPKASGFKMAASVIGLALVAGLSAVGYGYFMSGDGSGEPVVIAADNTPVKQKPEATDEGNIKVADNPAYKKVEGESQTASQETLISSREEVKPIASAKTEERLAPSANEAETESVGQGVSPRKVRTVTVKPDGTIVREVVDAAPAIPAAPAAAPAPATDLAGTTEANTPSVVAANDSGGIDGAVTQGTIAIPAASPLPKPEAPAAREVAFQAPAADDVVVIKPAPQPKPAATKPAPTPAAVAPAPAPRPAAQPEADAPIQIASRQAPAVSPGSWAVQISSQRSEQAAQASYNNLRRRFPVIGNQPMEIQRATVDGRGTFYRVRLGAGSKDAASRLCNQLKSSGGSCFITR